MLRVLVVNPADGQAQVAVGEIRIQLDCAFGGSGGLFVIPPKNLDVGLHPVCLWQVLVDFNCLARIVQRLVEQPRLRLCPTVAVLGGIGQRHRTISTGETVIAQQCPLVILACLQVVFARVSSIERLPAQEIVVGLDADRVSARSPLPFRLGQLHLQRVDDLAHDAVLEFKQVRRLAVVILRPKHRVGSSIDQGNVYA